MLDEALAHHNGRLGQVALGAQDELVDEEVEELLEVPSLVGAVDRRLLRLQSGGKRVTHGARGAEAGGATMLTSSSQRLCAPSSVPKNLIGSEGGRFSASATATMFVTTVLMPLPRPSIFDSSRGIL